MKIIIGSDHAGFDLKNELKDSLESQGIEVEDVGPFSSESVDYPEFGHLVAQKVSTNDQNVGILICGSGNGVNMTANKHKGIRSALAWNAEVASLAKKHNNANVLALPARFISLYDAISIVDSFLTSSFEGGRHGRRVSSIDLN